MNDPRPAKKIVELVDKPAQDINVVYLGTATYDIGVFKARQTERFAELGCNVQSLDIANDDDGFSDAEINQIIDQADVIVVGGGNTLYAVDRWRSLGIDDALERAMMRGAVLSGGSCGAISWFDGGHSSMFFSFCCFY